MSDSKSEDARPEHLTKSFTIKLGDAFYMGISTEDGKGISPGRVLVVDKITRTRLTLKDYINGDNYVLHR